MFLRRTLLAWACICWSAADSAAVAKPLRVRPNQAAVGCHDGDFQRWYVDEGDYVAEGDPVAEVCPHNAFESVTCAAPKSGYVVAQQRIIKGGNIGQNIPDMVLAVIEPPPRVIAAPAALADHESMPSFGSESMPPGPVYSCAVSVIFDTMPNAGAQNALKVCMAQALLVPEDAVAIGSISHLLGAGSAIASMTISQEPAAAHSMDSFTASMKSCVGEAARAPARIQHIRLCRDASPSLAFRVSTHVRCKLAPPLDMPVTTSTSRPTTTWHPVAAGRDITITMRPPVTSIPAYPHYVTRVRQHHRYKRTWWSIWWPFLLGLLLALCVCLSFLLCCVKRLNKKKMVYMPVGEEDREEAYRHWQNEEALIERSDVVKVEFTDSYGRVQIKYFNYREHGMTFTDFSPVRLKEFGFNSHASELGVQPGWMITSLGDQVVSRSCSLAELLRMLFNHFQHLPPWPLRMTFDTVGNGSATQTVLFNNQPLGIEFSKQTPIKVDHFKPDSYAEKCGVRVGWVVQSIGNVTMTQNVSLAMFMKYLNDGLAHLPQEQKGLRIDFEDSQSNRREFFFQRQPIGIRLSRTTPVKVEDFDFNSYAKDRGVQAGWAIVQIGDFAVSSSQNWEYVQSEIVRGSSTLELWPLRIDFHEGQGKVKTFYFSAKPLGMDMTDASPFKITNLHSNGLAETHGAKLGWEVLRIGNTVMSRDTQGRDVQKYLLEGLAHLPAATSGGGTQVRVSETRPL